MNKTKLLAIATFAFFLGKGLIWLAILYFGHYLIT